MNGYKDALAGLTDKHFVTLTVPNVPGHKLSGTIEAMNKALKLIRERMRKRGTPVIGIKKMECTYNYSRNDYHPHFHLIVAGTPYKGKIKKDSGFFIDGSFIAKNIIDSWLTEFPECSRDAQDSRPADDNSVMELFKYFSKLIVKTDKGREFHPESLDIIFRAMKGKRVFQPMGIEKVTEEVEEVQQFDCKGIKPTEEGKPKIWLYNDVEADYFDTSGGRLTKYKPSKVVRELRGMVQDIDPGVIDREIKGAVFRQYRAERELYWKGVEQTIWPEIDRKRKYWSDVMDKILQDYLATG
jgi:hypothetical protein